MSDEARKAIGLNFVQTRMVTVRAVAVASRAYVYLPRYVAYINCKAGMSQRPDYFLACYQDAGWTVEAVGVAGESLGSWLMMESNYPCQLSRNGAEKSRDVPGPEL